MQGVLRFYLLHNDPTLWAKNLSCSSVHQRMVQSTPCAAVYDMLFQNACHES